MTFSGLLSKSIKHHAASNTSSTAAASPSEKPVSANAAVATTTVTATAAAPQEHVHNHTQGTDSVSPNTHDTPDPVLSMAMASSSLSSQPRSASIDPAALSIEPPSSSPSQLQMLSSQPTATVSKLDMKQPPTPLSPPSTTPSSPAATGVFTAITKKRSFSHQQQQQEQTLSPVQSASYRKRLNVNQVCDWCRYRKIRCDRESPCNSCQHSKRECIRTPPEVLLSKLSKEAEDSLSSSADSTATSTPTVRANKRSSTTDDQESQSSSLKAKKIARSSSIAHSLIGVSVEHNTINSTCSLSPPVMGPLSLSLPSTMGLSHCGEKQQPQNQQSKTMLASGILGTPTPTSLQDQEHLERMRRIEMLLSNVIPGAAEFIAHGHQRNSGSLSTAAPSDLGLEKQQQQQQQRQQQQQQHTLSHISPVLTAAGSPLGHKPIQGDKCDSPSSLSPIIQADGNRSLGVGEGQNQGRRLSVFAGQEYIERMKRIELLLGSVQDNHSNNNGSTPVTKLSLAVPSSVASLNVDTNDEVKKESATATRKIKAAGSKKVARNSDGTIIKRPHVAAGFAGQKPPPKLPQAIAEAAMKKLVGKKKKRTAAASNNASAASPKPTAVTPSTACTSPIAAPIDVAAGAPANPASSTTSALAQTPIAHELTAGVLSKAESPAPVTLSSPKSFDIPSTIDHHHHHFAQQQLQQQKGRAQSLARQQQPGPGHLNTQLHGSVSYHHDHHSHHHPHRKHQHLQNAPCASSSQASSAFMGGLSHQHSQTGRMTSIRSISIPTIPLSNTMASYESLVVPAYTSAESSPASSPKATATTIELPISIHSSSVAATVPVGSTMDFLGYESTSSYSPFSAGVGLEGGADFAMALNMIHSGSSDHHHQLTTSIDGTTHTTNNNSQVLLPFATHPTALMYSHHPHHLQQQQQQQQSHHALHIPQDTHPMSLSSSGMPDFSGLQMTESLESWMSSQLVVPTPSLDGGFLSSTDIITSTATVQPLVAHHIHASPISPLPISSSAFLTGGGGGRGGFGQLQHPQIHQHRSSIQHQHQQSFYIPQMLDDEDDSADNVNSK
ncbi:MAG: hypothetical protein J3R72DRAFT_74879 [Linnemannia gamsii]|nr:MAG: hypothetical protein J3R72DRAFT_74879 [Linnemannia gamsii]